MNTYSTTKYKLKMMLLKHRITREILFFIFQKKVYKNIIDRKIKKLLDGKYVLSKHRIDNLIVSVTSFPARINEVKYMLFSILSQSIIPERIVLWLTESQFPLKEKELPFELLAFKKYNVEIRWHDKDIRSYTKLIPSLDFFPDSFIVIADDDIFYPKKWLEKLWDEHLKYPDDIICHVANKIVFDEKNNAVTYKKWKWNIKSIDASLQYFPLGVGGVLYQKRLLYTDLANNDVFLKLAPYADDIWFYFMIVLNNTQIRVVKKPYYSMKFVNPYREYNIVKQYKLSAINLENDENDTQFKNTFDYYRDKYITLIDKK